MLAYQRSQLSQLLHHARAQAPFYKHRLGPAFRGNGEIDWNRWHEIPIVTRADLRDKRNEMLAATMPPGHGQTKAFYSFGSSGVPIAMETAKITMDANRAAAWRFYQLQGIDKKSAPLCPIPPSPASFSTMDSIKQRVYEIQMESQYLLPGKILDFI